MARALSPLWIIGLGGALLALLSKGAAAASARGDAGDPNAPGPLPDMGWNPNVNADNPNAWPVEGLDPSPQLIAWLKRREDLLLTKTDLGDGGFTIGYGHFEPYGPRADAMPATIDAAGADALFATDLDARGAAIVRKYVNVPQTQNQFDALVSLAFNLSPASFAQIAQSVNAGGGIDPIALDYVRAGSQFEAGLRARRAAEIAMYGTGSYA